MNTHTLNKLEKNPFYKMNEKQKQEYEYSKRVPMQSFGDVYINDNNPRIVRPRVLRKESNGKK